MNLETAVAGRDLPRRSGHSYEMHPGLDTIPGVLTTRDGTRLRTLITRPSGVRHPLPGILFVQWLSCDSIELKAEAEDGWSRMIRRVAREWLEDAGQRPFPEVFDLKSPIQMPMMVP